MLCNVTNGHLFVIGAYRNTKVPSVHPVWAMLDTIRQAGTASQTSVWERSTMER